MKAEDIVIGRNYRIRQWDDMEAEFGLDEDGDIPCSAENARSIPCFAKGMRHLCGREFTPTAIGPYGDGETDLDPPMGLWTIWPFMLEAL